MTDSAEQAPLPLTGSKQPVTLLHVILLLVGLGVGGPAGTMLGGQGSVLAIEQAETRIKEHVAAKVESSEARILGRIETLAQSVSDHARRIETLEKALREHERRDHGGGGGGR